MLTKIDEFIIGLFQKYLVDLTQKKPIWLAQQCTYLMALFVLLNGVIDELNAWRLITGALMIACFWLQTHHEMLWDICNKTARTPFQIVLRFFVIFLWLLPMSLILLIPNVSLGIINTAVIWGLVLVISYLEPCGDPAPPEPRRKMSLNNS
jgi:Na+/pantothenate symporter